MAYYISVRHKKHVLVVLLAVCGVLVAGGVYIYTQRQESPADLQKTSTGYEVNLAPPTEEEKKETEQNKQQLAQDQEKEQAANPPPATDKTTQTPFIVFAGQEGQKVELTGYVSGIFEDGGTCTATFTKATLRVSGQSTGFKDYNHTSCLPISIDRSKFQQPGDWQVTLSYESTSVTGVSKASTVVVK